jgi:hypothetical protein
MGAGGDGRRLAMRFGPEGGGAHIRHPYLDRAQALLAQALAVFAYLDARGLGG